MTSAREREHALLLAHSARARSSSPAMTQEARETSRPANEPRVRLIGARRHPLRDFYHAFLSVPWWVALGGIVALYLALNACFAGVYLVVGGIANARPGSFADAFFFSVQTMGTIGYGAMYPIKPAANMLVVLESVTSLMVTAIATGLIFTKFSKSRARVVFSTRVAIAPMDGTPTLMIRVGNERGNNIMDAVIRVAMVRTERTREGMVFYRMIDLPLSRERAPALSRSWTALHPITETSPLFDYTPERIDRDEVEVTVTLVGVDDTSLQPVHARQTYEGKDIVWGARHTDILSIDAEGVLILDLRKFHELTKTEPTPTFPYPRAAETAPSALEAS
jgi:inward rectifier potassium channel